MWCKSVEVGPSFWLCGSSVRASATRAQRRVSASVGTAAKVIAAPATPAIRPRRSDFILIVIDMTGSHCLLLYLRFGQATRGPLTRNVTTFLCFAYRVNTASTALRVSYPRAVFALGRMCENAPCLGLGTFISARAKKCPSARAAAGGAGEGVQHIRGHVHPH